MIKNLIFFIFSKAVQNFGKQLETHQQLLIKLVDITIWIYLSKSDLLGT
ncbi:MAG: hypothetical protein ABI045_04670 [Flavobacteriales bacterium]